MPYKDSDNDYMDVPVNLKPGDCLMLHGNYSHDKASTQRVELVADGRWREASQEF